MSAASTVTLLPTQTAFGIGEPAGIEVRRNIDGDGDVDGSLTVWRLGVRILEQPVRGAGVYWFHDLSAGGYGVEFEHNGTVARTAIEVTRNDRARLRYGFVASYRPDKDIAGVVDFARRLHLTGIQFYDWAYRHADLLGGGEIYDDALGQPISLGIVRTLVDALQKAGSHTYGYAAVYAVGPQEWHQWKAHALLTATGEPYALGDFLFLVDPSAEAWLAHFRRQLTEATDRVGFDGFHLDQYGYPKFAATHDGQAVDVATSFVRSIAGIRDALPQARLIFNNVNDFPTWRTGTSPQDAVYIEVWEPHLTLGSLVTVVSRARHASAGQPIVIAAYQHVYDQAAAPEADLATAFTMATLFSHGATQLLAGENGRVLVDPYYVRNHEASISTIELLTRWYDFLVEHDSLLLSPHIVDVTGSYTGPYNGDLDLSYPNAAVEGIPTPGTVWRRVTSTADGLVVHAINLLGQTDTFWDAPRAQVQSPGEGQLRFRHIKGRTPRVRVADPDSQPRLVQVPVHIEGDYAVAAVPAPHIWQVIHVSL